MTIEIKTYFRDNINTSLNYDPIYNLGFENYKEIGRDCHLFLGGVHMKHCLIKNLIKRQYF